MELLKPKFNLDVDIDLQKGYFFNTDEVSSNIQGILNSVGVVRSTDGNLVGSCFVISNEGRKFLVSAKHCFYESTPSGFENFLKREACLGEVSTLLTREREIKLPPAFNFYDISIFKVPDEIPVNGLHINKSWKSSIQRKRIKSLPIIIVGIPVHYNRRHGLTDEAYSFTVGNIISDDGSNHLFTDARIERGFSGGPVITQSGEVLAVTIQYATDFNGITDYRFPSSYQYDLLPSDIGYSEIIRETSFHRISAGKSVLLHRYNMF